MKFNFLRKKKKKDNQSKQSSKKPMSLLPLNKGRSKVRLKAAGQR